MSERPDISLEEVLVDGIAGALLDLHTALPGIVKSYDAATGTVNVQPAVKRAIESGDGTFAYQSLPTIPNVRVCWSGSQGFELRFPLATGDTVWLMFAEADMQKWENTGQESNPGWLARHGLGSCVAYPYSRVRPPGSNDPAVANLPQIVAPEPLHVGDPVTAKALAQAEKVEAQFAALKDAITNAVVVANDGGASLKSTILAALGAWPADTACVKLKAE